MGQQLVTPEYLLEHGFVQYKTTDETYVFDIPFYNKNDMHFMERDFNRNLFVVILIPYAEGGYDYIVFVQKDAGCGFIKMPLRYVELHAEHFEALYYGIHGKKLSK